MNFSSQNQKLESELFQNAQLEVFLKREDQLHPVYGGNKIRKLKYHIEAFRKSNKKHILTFGGAWSNHIYACAGYFSDHEISSIAIIRGERPKHFSNTLLYAQEKGMHLKFISRQEYREKNDLISLFSSLQLEMDDYYIVPEGGGGEMGIKGCKEILTSSDLNFDFVACSLGTGSTFKGIISTINSNQKAVGFPALKDSDFLLDELREYNRINGINPSFELKQDYHFGGYAKVNSDLIAFIQNFYTEFNIKLDPIYTGKMLYGLFDLIQRNYFPKGSKVLIIHTGGLQGSIGIENKLKTSLYPEMK